MRLLLLLGLAALALPASAQTRLTPNLGATVARGGQAGSAMRVTTYAERPADRGRLALRYRGVAVNRSPKTAANGPTAPTAFTSGDVAMPALRTPQGDFVNQRYGSFRVVRARGY